MDSALNESKKKEKRPRGSGLSFLLAFLLLLGTLFEGISFLNPATALERAVEKTAAEQQGELLPFLARCFADGSLEAVGEKQSIAYTATLPKAAALTTVGESGKGVFGVMEDEVFFASPALGEDSYTMARQGAADALAGSVFSDGGMPPVQLRLMRAFLAGSDKALLNASEVLEEGARALFDAADPSLKKEKINVDVGEKSKKATRYRYETDGEGLGRMLGAYEKFGKEQKEFLSAAVSFLSAVATDGLEDAQREVLLQLLMGQGEEYGAWKKELCSENGRAVLDITVRDSRVWEVTLALKGGKAEVKGNLSLSPQKNSKESLVFTLQTVREGEERFFLSLSSKVTEDSKSAKICEYGFCLRSAALLPEQGEEKGSLIFSWGKQKGDLGLKLTLSCGSINLRGADPQFKKGKSLSFVLSRVEVDGVTLLEEALTVTLLPEGETPNLSKGKIPLPTEGEERGALAQLLSGYFSRFSS